MARFRNITKTQTAFFEEYGLICPFTADVAYSLIQFVEDDHYGGNRAERLETLRAEQRRWIGNTALRIKTGDPCGRVRCLTARSPQMMRETRRRTDTLRELCDHVVSAPSRFMAIIEPPNGKNAITIGLEHLEIRER